MKKIFLLFTILLYGVVSFAQENAPDYTPNILPRSPQAEQYMRYGEIPVGLSTGVPEISIPIYTIQVGGLSIPISISYHASGIKVEDEATSVGLGWVLNAGGMITQTVSGTQDNFVNNYEFTSSSDAYARLSSDQRLRDINPYWYNLLNDPKSYAYKTVSDRFTYNFNGNYGTFRKDINDKKYKTIPYTRIKIEQPDINHFVVTDTEGIIWTFKRFLSVETDNGESGYEYHIISVKKPDSSTEIKFQYETGSKQYFHNWKKHLTAHSDPKWNFDYTCFVLCRYDVTIQDQFNNTYPDFSKNQQTSITPILLKKIEWQDSEIVFEYESKKRLDKIIIKSGSERFETKLDNKGFNFGGNKNVLEGLKIKNDYYSFEYEKSIQLPSQASSNCNIDFWGYHNGKNSNYWMPIKAKYTYPNTVELEYVSGREVNPKYTQFAIIKSIKYPTGGKTEFKFENNQGKNVYGSWMSSQMSETFRKYFGGLRIKQICNYDYNNILIGKKTFEYDGAPVLTIDLHHFYNKKLFLQKTDFPYPNERYVDIGGYTQFSNLYHYDFLFSQYIYNCYSSEIAPITNLWGQSHFYDKVTEYDGDAIINNNGKTEYEFQGLRFGENVHLNKSEYGVLPYLLKSKKVFKKEDKLYVPVFEIINHYENVYQDSFLAGVSVEDNDRIFMFDPTNQNYGSAYDYYVKNSIPDYYYNSFKFYDIIAFSKHTLLKSTEETSYTDKGIIKSTISYDYDPQLRVLSPIKTQTTNSQGQTITGTTTYPFNYSGGIYSTMLSRNMLNYPVEQITQTGTTETTRVKTEYGLWNNLILPVQIFSSVNGGTLTKEISFDKYNSKGNLLQYTMRDGVPVSFVWGYNYQYPVAKIANATYDRAKIALGRASNTDDLPYLQTLTGASLHAELNKLRSISGTFVETYEYKPLFGIIKATDPSGFATTYDYDSFGRLEQIKDHNGNILEKYKYNYIKQ